MVRAEWPLAITVATMALFSLFGEAWLAGLSSAFWFFFVVVWLFVALLVSAFAVVRHAKGLAVLLNEPFGTLVLTMAMSGMEMIMIAAVMYVGHGESSLGRDTMLSIIMIVMNGLIGISLPLGGLRYPDLTCNLHGATNFRIRDHCIVGARFGPTTVYRIVTGARVFYPAGWVSRPDVLEFLRNISGNSDSA